MKSRCRVVVLADNYAGKSPYSEWGFSVLINSGKKSYLFDVGNSGKCVLDSAKHQGLSLFNLDGILFSHGHYDHTNGLEEVIRELGPQKIFAHPEIFRNRYSIHDGRADFSGIKLRKNYIESGLHSEIHFESGIMDLGDNIYLTGTVPFTNEFEKISDHFKYEVDGELKKDDFPDDNSVIIDTSEGLVVIFGCAHRGIVNILNYVKKTFNKKIHAIIGGTHLYEAKEDHFNFVIDFLKNEDLKIIAPCHCTGMKRIVDLYNAFPERVVLTGSGEQFIFD